MNGLAKAIILFVSLIWFGAWSGNALAAAKVASAGANWAAATWTPAGVPTASDTCTINSGVNLTVTTAAVCGSLAIGTNTSTNTTLTLAAGGSLDITTAGGQSGNLVLNPSNRNSTFTLATATQTLTVDGTFTTGTSGTHVISVSTGQVNFTNAAGITWPARGTLTITGNPSAGASAFFAGLVTQTAGTIQNTGGTASILTFDGGFDHSGGTFTTRAGETINFGGDYTNSGGTQTFNAASTENFTGTATITPTSAITFGNLVIDPGAGNTVTLAGNVTAAGNLTVNTGTFDLATFTAARTAGGGTLTIANGATMLVGASNYPTNYATDALGPTSTVVYDGPAQTVVTQAAPGYGNLTLSGSGTKTMPAAAVLVQGTFTMAGAAGTSATLGGALTVGGDFSIGATNTFANSTFALNVAGDFAQNGTFTAGTGVVTLNGGAAVQTISGTGTLGFANLTVNNTGGITLTRNVTVTSAIIGAVTLTSTCPTDYTLTSNGGLTIAHSCPPTSVVNSINCAVSCAATSAATVSWTVTFNKSVTGVDASAFALVASGLSGAYIATVTGSGTTWTVTANTGIGVGTLGLNQTGPGLVSPTLTGTFTGQVYTITATPALAEYRLDEASWNGTAGEVLDSSGTYPGQAVNAANTTGTAPAIAGTPGTCRYGVFDNGGTITQGYVALPGFPNLNTDFTITAWIRTTNNTVGAQRILIDDESNTGGYGLSLAEGGTGALRFYSRGSSAIILDTPLNTIANNTWYFVAGVADITNGIRRIYVFNATGSLLAGLPVSVASTGWGTDTGMASIGGETNLSGEPPAANHFKGNIDEVRVYQKVLNQSALAAIATQTHPCVSLDHIQLEYTAPALTCAPLAVTVKACADALCSLLYPGSVTVDLSNTAGAWSADPITFIGGSAISSLTVAAPSTVTIGTTTVSPSPLAVTTCSPNCVVTFNTCLFDAVETGAAPATPIYTKLAGTLFNVDVLALYGGTSIRTGYTGTVSVELVDATTGGGVCGSMSALAPLTLSPTSPYPFVSGDSGRKNFSVTYANAVPNARVRIKDSAASVTSCSSDNFAIRPQSFTVTANLGGATLKAGNNFTMTAATAVGAGYTGTPVLNAGQLRDHNGAAAGVLNGSFSAATGTSATGTFQYHDVGTISLQADAVTDSVYTTVDQASDCVSGSTSNTLASGKYGCNVGSVAAGPFGRFYPDHFTYAATLTPACAAGTFTYMDQPALGLNLNLTAQSANGTTTSRYTAGYSTLGTFSITGDNSGTAVSAARLSPALPAFAWSNGVYTVTGNRAFTRNAAPDGPYDSFALKANILTEPDGVAITGTNLSNITKIRYGRARLLNANGSELLALPMTFRLEYWQGAATGWQINAADTCTAIIASNFAFAFPIGGAPKPNNLVACETALLAMGGSAPNYTLSLIAPGATNDGWADLTLNLDTVATGNRCTAVGPAGAAATTANAPWLRYKWTSAADSNPAARATFGVYKSDPVIFRRERY